MKTRKSLLISSVAMLLVAMFALGTATFAWFTNNTSTTADGISVKTVQASDLRVASTKYSFTNDLDYEYNNQTFKPASSSNGSAWFTGVAEKSSNYAIKAGEKFTPVDVQLGVRNDYVFAEELNIRNYGSAAVDDVTITFTISETAVTEGENYLRVALVPSTGNKAGVVEGAFTTTIGGEGADKDNAKYIFDKDGQAYNAVSDADTASISIKPSTSYSLNIGTLAGKGEAFVATGETPNEANFNLYVWFEGQDEQCYNANAGNALPTITFSITGTTVGVQ